MIFPYPKFIDSSITLVPSPIYMTMLAALEATSQKLRKELHSFGEK